MSYRTYAEPKPGQVGIVILDGLGTRRIEWQPCWVLGETRKKFRVRARDEEMRLASNQKAGDRIILVGETVLVAKHAVTIDLPKPEARVEPTPGEVSSILTDLEQIDPDTCESNAANNGVGPY